MPCEGHLEVHEGQHHLTCIRPASPCERSHRHRTEHPCHCLTIATLYVQLCIGGSQPMVSFHGLASVNAHCQTLWEGCRWLDKSQLASGHCAVLSCWLSCWQPVLSFHGLPEIMHSTQFHVRVTDGSAAAPVHLVIGHAGATTSPNLLPEQPSFWHRVDLVHGFLRIEANATIMTCEVSNKFAWGSSQSNTSQHDWLSVTVRSFNKGLGLWTCLNPRTAPVIVAGRCLLCALCSAFTPHPRVLTLRAPVGDFQYCWLPQHPLKRRSSTSCPASVLLSNLSQVISDCLLIIPDTADQNAAKN